MRQPAGTPLDDLTSAAEDFLKAVFRLEERGERVSTTALAAELAITPPSVTGMIQRLAGHGYILHEPYRGVRLTDEGRRAALEVVRHHRLLETYLVRELGIGLDAAHAEACRLEHALSEALEERIATVLGHPTHDPHGDPIPTADLALDAAAPETLAGLARTERGRIGRIPGDDPALVRYLDQLGILPGAVVTVVSVAPFDGPLTLEVAGASLAISSELARSIHIVRL
jgi:DtxR family transcriptional regulator, Mn-dependent transcriptional regulator